MHTVLLVTDWKHPLPPPCSEPPEVDITAETFVVNETNPAVLTCVATGIPAPSITWFVDASFFMLGGGGGSMMVPIDSDGIDYSISSTTRVLGSQNIEVTSTLTVHNTAMNDSGVYTCEAMNSLGSVNDTAELIVQCKCLVAATLTLNQVECAIR